MKLKILLTTVITVFSSLAFAGLHQPAPIEIDLVLRTAQGDMLTAANSVNSDEFIGCGTRSFDDGVNPTRLVCPLILTENNKIANKISQSIGILSRLKHFLPMKAKLMIYNSLILPHFNYGILAWGYNCERIIKLQKKSVRIISLAK